MNDFDALYRLADQLESLDEVAEEAAAEVAPEIERQIKALGRAGGPLRAGNAAAAEVYASGSTVHIRAVFTKASKQRSWARTAARAVQKAIARRLTGA